jgi:hypothetical protein
MIQYIKRKDLEVAKYDACIENSIQIRVYAFSWYLDIVADHWDVLVLDDYEAVMPIPWKQKYFIKYVTQPFFCQQLGVFSKEILTEDLQEKMMKKIPKKIIKISLNFNADNHFTVKMIKKKNYILKIENTYLINYERFNKNRKRVLKKTQKKTLYIREMEFSSLLKLAKENYSYLPYQDLDYKKIEILSEKIKKNKCGFIFGVFKDEKLLGGVFFLKDNFRITYLFSVMNKEGKELNAITYLISEIIKNFVGKGYIFDFEGSMDVGISNFFKSFGAVNENYYQYKTDAFKRIFI